MSINYRHNVMDIGSVATFARVRGGCSQGNRDVYFLRMVGGNDALSGEIREIDELLGAAMDRRQLLYKRLKTLPNDIGNEDRDYYLSAYDKWVSADKASAQIRFENGNVEFGKVLGTALKAVEEAYDRFKTGNTASIRRNFIIKLMAWTDFVMKDNPLPWNERSCMKIVADNVVKVQEYLFYDMLTLIGADVVLLQTKQDIELPDWLQAYSKKLSLGEYVTWELPEYRRIAPAEKKAERPAQSQAASEQRPAASEQRPVVAERSPAECDGGGAKQTGEIQVSIPKRPCKTPPAAAPMPVRTTRPGAQSTNAAGHREKSFEELAMLASSVVMITIHDDRGESVGSGSGIMIGEDGYILTNFHVIRGGCFYSVSIEDDDNVYHTNKLIKYHAEDDMAIIRIPRKLQPLPLYRGSEKLVRGQRVVAIGSPLGLFNSVSDGIISGFRTIDSVDMLQFTAPTSPGSSGGAILNLYGEVIGISTAGIDRGQNINLAVSYESIAPFIRGFC